MSFPHTRGGVPDVDDVDAAGIIVFPTHVGVYLIMTRLTNDGINVFPTHVGVYRALDKERQKNKEVFPTHVGVYLPSHRFVRQYL